MRPDLSDWEKTSNGAFINRTAKVFAGSLIGPRTIIDHGVLFGLPDRAAMRMALLSTDDNGLTESPELDGATGAAIGSDCHIHAYSVISAGVKLADHVICTESTTAGSFSVIGSYSKLQYRAQIHHRVQIGEECRVGGFCCNDSRLDKRVSMYGALVHHYAMHGNNSIPGAPHIHSDSIIAFGAVVVGGITIGARSYVAAGAVVTLDVPMDSIVINVNEIHSRQEWQGRIRLRT